MTRALREDDMALMTLVFAIVLVVHGLIHLLGFAKAFQLADLPESDVRARRRSRARAFRASRTGDRRGPRAFASPGSAISPRRGCGGTTASPQFPRADARTHQERPRRAMDAAIGRAIQRCRSAGT